MHTHRSRDSCPTLVPRSTASCALPVPLWTARQVSRPTVMSYGTRRPGRRGRSEIRLPRRHVAAGELVGTGVRSLADRATEVTAAAAAAALVVEVETAGERLTACLAASVTHLDAAVLTAYILTRLQTTTLRVLVSSNSSSSSKYNSSRCNSNSNNRLCRLAATAAASTTAFARSWVFTHQL